ncbi:MAG TPA: sodium:solute symporter family protein [Gaiellaceae bacterium]|jgi:SSS family solute:Na+ symporter|nr:sodium:solute symporter family protein [Gaiellaceae bacterium]
MTVAAIEVTQAIVIAAAFALITVIGLFAGRWRKADLDDLDEWALGGRQFGGVLTWFLQGGSIYTTYSFIAVPALVFGGGAIGFFALPYLVITYLVAFVLVPKLWQLARDEGHVTPADFVRARFGNRWLSAAVTLTGIVATMPYIALQVYGIEICMAQIGLPVDASLWVAFALLAVITYVSGLRSATLIAVVKDVFIWVTVIVAVIYIPIHLGGYAHAFSKVPASRLTLPGNLYANYVTLAIGSGLALFLYPHTLTGALASKSRFVVQRNSIFLPVYTVMLGLLALLGYLAIAAGIKPDAHYGNNIAVPALFDQVFPSWFAGFALASIAIGALVPAAMMAIASANLFARNIWLEFKPGASPKEQTQVSKIASLVVKFGAVNFVIMLPTTFVINFQLAAGVWILQTVPAVFGGLLWKRLSSRAAIAGWAAGTAYGSYLLAGARFATSSHDFGWGTHHTKLFIGVPALALNIVVALGVTFALRLKRGEELTPVQAA